MTLITMTGDKVMMKDGAVRTESACCCASGAPCTGEMCASTGCLCVSQYGTFRHIFITFDTDATDPCMGTYNPLFHGDCTQGAGHEAVASNYQMDFCCAQGANDNKIQSLFFNNYWDYFTSSGGGLYNPAEVGVSCLDKRVVMWFGAERTNHYISTWTGEVRTYIDFGPMPANCNNINGLTASGTLYWTDLSNANCNVSRPFTATISTACNAEYFTAVGCA